MDLADLNGGGEVAGVEKGERRREEGAGGQETRQSCY